MNIDLSYLNNLILIIIALGVGFLSALWLALVIWTWRDIHSRTLSIFTQILAVLIVAVLYVPGILVYMILRPTHTIEEDYQRSLEEEALLVTIEAQAICPGCKRHVREDWLLCPNCRTKLKKNCLNCEKLMELSWDICPFCGKNSPAPAAASQIDNETETEEILPAVEKEIPVTPLSTKEIVEGDQIIFFDSIDELDELSGYQKFKVIENLEKEQDSEEEPK